MEENEIQLESRIEYLAESIRRRATELKEAHFGSAFVDSDLDGPDDSDYDLFDGIIDFMIWLDISQAEEEDCLAWGDPEDVLIKDNTVDDYLTLFEDIGWSDRDDLEEEGRWRLLTSLAVDILADVLIQEEEVRAATCL